MQSAERILLCMGLQPPLLYTTINSIIASIKGGENFLTDEKILKTI